jgi:dipeptidyl-peptidase-3
MKHKMSLKLAIPLMAMSAHLMTGCGNGDATSNTAKTDTVAVADGYDDNFVVEAQSFADLQLLRYQVPGFNSLPLQQKKLAYYLYEAALCGRDIIYDQKSKLLIRKKRKIEP